MLNGKFLCTESNCGDLFIAGEEYLFYKGRCRMSNGVLSGMYDSLKSFQLLNCVCLSPIMNSGKFVITDAKNQGAIIKVGLTMEYEDGNIYLDEKKELKYVVLADNPSREGVEAYMNSVGYKIKWIEKKISIRNRDFTVLRDRESENDWGMKTVIVEVMEFHITIAVFDKNKKDHAEVSIHLRNVEDEYIIDELSQYGFEVKMISTIEVNTIKQLNEICSEKKWRIEIWKGEIKIVKPNLNSTEVEVINLEANGYKLNFTIDNPNGFKINPRANFGRRVEKGGEIIWIGNY